MSYWKRVEPPVKKHVLMKSASVKSVSMLGVLAIAGVMTLGMSGCKLKNTGEPGPMISQSELSNSSGETGDVVTAPVRSSRLSSTGSNGSVGIDASVSSSSGPVVEPAPSVTISPAVRTAEEASAAAALVGTNVGGTISMTGSASGEDYGMDDSAPSRTTIVERRSTGRSGGGERRVYLNLDADKPERTSTSKTSASAAKSSSSKSTAKAPAKGSTKAAAKPTSTAAKKPAATPSKAAAKPAPAKSEQASAPASGSSAGPELEIIR
jgi:hypothetical protein